MEKKFRVWDKTLQGWSKNTQHFVHQRDKDHLFVYPEQGDRFLFEQFTGFSDKNGKEIFEGDVLECSHLETKEKEIQMVKLIPGQFAVSNPGCCERCKTGDGCTAYLSDWANLPQHWSIEIVGNIYENPDLLK